MMQFPVRWGRFAANNGRHMFLPPFGTRQADRCQSRRIGYAQSRQSAFQIYQTVTGYDNKTKPSTHTGIVSWSALYRSWGVQSLVKKNYYYNNDIDFNINNKTSLTKSIFSNSKQITRDIFLFHMIHSNLAKRNTDKIWKRLVILNSEKFKMAFYNTKILRSGGPIIPIVNSFRKKAEILYCPTQNTFLPDIQSRPDVPPSYIWKVKYFINKKQKIFSNYIPPYHTDPVWMKEKQTNELSFSAGMAQWPITDGQGAADIVPEKIRSERDFGKRGASEPHNLRARCARYDEIAHPQYPNISNNNY